MAFLDPEIINYSIFYIASDDKQNSLELGVSVAKSVVRGPTFLT